MRLHLIWLLTISNVASAELYKCTDTSGAVTYQAMPCIEMSEEILTVQPSPEIRSNNEKKNVQVVNPSKPQVEGTRSSTNSPLAKAYRRFINSLSGCRRSRVLKQVSEATRAEMALLSLVNFEIQCRALKSFARTDFANAFEKYEVDTAKLVWEEQEERRDGNATFRSSSTVTVNFVKENGVWVFGE